MAAGVGWLGLVWRPFGLSLPQALSTARGRIAGKRGWLLRLHSPEGLVGWGEAAPLDGQLEPLAAAIAGLGPQCSRPQLEGALAAGTLPPSLGFALGAALAELDGLPQGRWLPPPPSARLLPAGPAALERLALERLALTRGELPVFKWKVAVHPDGLERSVLEQLLQPLPPDGRLRLDAHGGWQPATAWAWASPGWNGWSSPWALPTWRAWRPWPPGCRWPWMNPCSSSPGCARAGRAGRCGGPARRGIRGPCWRRWSRAPRG